MFPRAVCCLVALIVSRVTLPGHQGESRPIALVKGRVIVAPGAPALDPATVVIQEGRIAAVGLAAIITVPSEAQTIDCSNLTLVAGFRNSHVHFTEPKWADAASMPVERLTDQLRAMLTGYGFTTVLDTGSDPDNTRSIERRIDSGEVPGPRVLTTGPGFVPKGGTPTYLKPIVLPELIDLEQTRQMVRTWIGMGADAIKIFSGPAGYRGTMPLDLIEAVTSEAHRLERLVIAHPGHMAGLIAALDGGVDILAHVAEDDADRFDVLTASRMKAAGMSLVPTLKLFKDNSNLDDLLREVRLARNAGVQILFGMDVGYLTDYDPAPEYRLLARAGLSGADILGALTTAPAARWKEQERTGRIAVGLDGDVVALRGDPIADPAAFASVALTIRQGRIIYPR